MTFSLPLSNLLDMDISSIDEKIDFNESEIKNASIVIDFLEENINFYTEIIRMLKKKDSRLKEKRQKLIDLMIQKEIEMNRHKNCYSV